MPEQDKLNGLPPVAANGLLDRRLFMKSVAMGGLSVVAAPALADSVGKGQPPWLLVPGRGVQGYGMPSSHEQVARWIRPPGHWRGRTIPGVAFTPHQGLTGTYTPSGLHFEVNHHGIPGIDPDRHTLVIHGMVDRPLKFTVEALDFYPTVTHSHFLECSGNSQLLWADEPAEIMLDRSHGLLSASEWTGVSLASLLDEAGVQTGGKWIIAEGADSGSLSRSIPMEKAMGDSFVALHQNGERLRPGQGYPMRLFNPGFEGNTSVKWLRSLRVTNRPAMTKFETSKYTDLMPDGKALQFSLKMDVKSVITRPSNALILPKKSAVYEVTGLAWSGSGRIRKVEVSADGGSTWAEAALHGPVLPIMLTRFRVPWRWDGSPTILQSRATDETGRVQPTRRQLIQARGNQSVYHYHAIHSWAVRVDGSIAHVYA
jgi:sulfane dehydrogenase subunit SoxC